MADLSVTLDPSLVGTPAYGDLLLAGGDLVLTNDADARGQNCVLQDLTFRLRTFAGECFVNTTLGVPWYQQLLGPYGKPSLTDAVLQNVVLSTPGVLQLTDWSTTTDRVRRVVHVTFRAVTASGQVDYRDTVGLQAQGEVA